MTMKKPHLDEAAFKTGIFKALTRDEWRITAQLPSAITHPRKSTVFVDGENAGFIYLVGSGLIKAFRSPMEDRVQIINIFGTGDIVGAEALTQDVYCHSASTLNNTVVFRYTRDIFRELMFKFPKLAMAVVDQLHSSNTRLQTLIVDLGTKKALQRVASCIIRFSHRNSDAGRREPFTLPISRQEMGSLLGLSPETVSRQIKDLTDARVIRIQHKRVTVLDHNQLLKIANVD